MGWAPILGAIVSLYSASQKPKAPSTPAPPAPPQASKSPAPGVFKRNNAAAEGAASGGAPTGTTTGALADQGLNLDKNSFLGG